jgi:glycosyltransferase involved in cell wall biosynthesis
MEVIVYVGRLDLAKGLGELVSSVSSLRDRRPRLRCYIVGDGPARQPLAEAIAGQNADEQISLMPSCSTEEVANWMAAADVITLPSYREGCPNVVIEALASGRPVVATRVGGIPELMDDASGRLVPARDADALASALDQVLGQPWSPEAIAGRHSRSWSDVSDDVETILRATLERSTKSTTQR